MKTITLENGIKLIVMNSDIAHILIEQFNRLSISANVADTTQNEVDKANYTNYPCLLSDFNHLQRQDRFFKINFTKYLDIVLEICIIAIRNRIIPIPF